MLLSLRQKLSAAKALLIEEVNDPAVKKAILVILAMLALKYGLDQEHADTLATGVWTAASYVLARSPGKGQS